MFDGLIEALTAHVKEVQALDLKPHKVFMEIDGLTYDSTKLPASVGLEILPKVVSLMGSVSTKSLMLGHLEEVDPQELLLRVAFQAMQIGLAPLLKDLLASTNVSSLANTGAHGNCGKAFDSHFSGEYLHLMKVAYFVGCHNLSGFTRGAQ
jgi:hypothetical protein